MIGRTSLRVSVSSGSVRKKQFPTITSHHKTIIGYFRDFLYKLSHSCNVNARTNIEFEGKWIPVPESAQKSEPKTLGVKDFLYFLLSFTELCRGMSMVLSGV